MTRLHLLVRVTRDDLPVVKAWLTGLQGRTAALVQGYSDLHGYDLGVPAYSEFDLIPSCSVAEEAIYRRAHGYTVERNRRHADPHSAYLGVPLMHDIDSLTGATPERQLVLADALRRVAAENFDHIAVVLQHYSAFHFALLREAIRCDWAPAGARPLAPVAGRIEEIEDVYRPCPPEQLLPALHSVVRPLDPSAMPRLVAGVPAGEPILLVLSSNMVFARSAAMVVKAVRKRVPLLPVYVDSHATAEALAQLGCEDARVIQESAAYQLADAGGAIAAIMNLMRSLHADQGLQPLAAGLREADVFLALDKAKVQPTFCARLIEYCGFIEKMGMLLDQLRPVSVYRLPSHDNYYDHAIDHLCRNRSIPLVASSIMSFDEHYRNLTRFRHTILTVLGEEQAELVSRLDLAEHVVLVGQPEMDEARTKWSPQASARYIEKVLGGRPSKKIVLAATSALAPADELEWIEALADFAAQRGDFLIVVKLHPATPAGAYEALAQRRAELPLRIVRDWEIMPFLVSAHVVLTDLSHAGRQAVYLEKPIVIVNMTGQPYPYNRFDEEGVALYVDSTDALCAQVALVLDSPERVEAQLSPARAPFIRRHFTHNDGLSSQRIADLLFNPGLSGWRSARDRSTSAAGQ